MDNNGDGVLVYRGRDDLYAKGLNMAGIFEKVTPGQHERPEDPTQLIVACIGALAGTQGSVGRIAARP